MRRLQAFLRKKGGAVAKFLPQPINLILKKCVKSLTKFYVVEMRLKDLNKLLPAQVTDSFCVSPMKPGSEQDYVDVMRQSLKENVDKNWFHSSFSKDLEYDPQNLILIYKENTPIAAAAAWQIKRKGRWIGHLKNVGVVRDYQGRGYGRHISLCALRRLRDRGFSEVMLKTHDNRLPAISLYLSLGFEPKYNFWAGKRKWKRIVSQIK